VSGEAAGSPAVDAAAGDRAPSAGAISDSASFSDPLSTSRRALAMVDASLNRKAAGGAETLSASASAAGGFDIASLNCLPDAAAPAAPRRSRMCRGHWPYVVGKRSCADRASGSALGQARDTIEQTRLAPLLWYRVVFW